LFQPKYCGKSPPRPVLDIFSLPENDSGIHLSSKNLDQALANLSTLAVQHCKAAFKTTLGTYIPQVVYFGLRNPPPFFQRMMAHEFESLTRKYKSYLSNYLNNWIITMPGEEEGLKLH